MLPSFVYSVTNGTEKGHFLALDLGSTNFRVMLVRLDGKKAAEMYGYIFRVPDVLMKAEGTAVCVFKLTRHIYVYIQLFDHFAECLATVINSNKVGNVSRLPLGFIFSFPCRQEALNQALLLNWTKGFCATGVEGNDVAMMLREACQRRTVIISSNAAVKQT
jgi:hexokinase